MPSNTRSKGGPRHPSNIEIYNTIVKMKIALDLRGRKDASFCYGKVLQTLEKYPLPIISLKQAIKLDGIGTKLLTIINDILKHKYEEHRFPVDKSITDSRSGSKGKIDDYFNKMVKKVNEKGTKAGSAPPSIKKLHSIKLNNKDSFLLTSLYLKQKDDNNRNFFTKNEISQISESNTLFEDSQKTAFNIKTFERLEKCNFIEKLDFDIDYKYSLTIDGFKLAEEYFSQPADLRAYQKVKLISLTQPGAKTLPEKEFAPLKYLKTEIKEYEVKLYIDNREKRMKNNTSYFVDELKFAKIPLQLKNLPLADFAWVVDITTSENRHYTYLLDYLIERKTVDDLICSIKDGRYKDQKKRLKTCGVNHIYYLIEGDIQKEGGFAGLNTATNTTRLVDSFNVVNTENARGSVDFLIKLHTRVKRRMDQIINNEIIYFSRTYEDFFKKQNKFKNLKLKNATLNAISRLKGFGEGSAVKLVSLNPTMIQMYERLNEDRAEQDDILKAFLNKNQRKLIFDMFCKEDYGR